MNWLRDIRIVSVASLRRSNLHIVLDKDVKSMFGDVQAKFTTVKIYNRKDL